MEFIRALIVLHREYRNFPWRSRIHILIRFLTCPFLRVVKHVPRGTLLDIGGGHGLFAVLARERRASVTTVDPDVRKVRKLRDIESVAEEVRQLVYRQLGQFHEAAAAPPRDDPYSHYPAAATRYNCPRYGPIPWC